MSLHDSLTRRVFDLEDCHTDVQAADIFTKHFVKGEEWEHRKELIGVTTAERLDAVLRTRGK